MVGEIVIQLLTKLALNVLIVNKGIQLLCLYQDMALIYCFNTLFLIDLLFFGTVKAIDGLTFRINENEHYFLYLGESHV